MTSNILLINNGRILAEGNVHQIRDLIDEHPHTVYMRGDRPARAGPRGSSPMTTCSACGSRTERGGGARPRSPTRSTRGSPTWPRPARPGAIDEVTSPDDNLQAVFQYLVK